MTNPYIAVREKWMPRFAYEHLPEHLQSFSKPFHDMADDLTYAAQNGTLPASEVDEVMAALRKLLEAKDCIVRTAVAKKEEK